MRNLIATTWIIAFALAAFAAAPARASEPLPEDAFAGVLLIEPYAAQTALARATIRSYREASLMALDTLVAELQNGRAGLSRWQETCQGVSLKLAEAVANWELCFHPEAHRAASMIGSDAGPGWIASERQAWKHIAETGITMKELADRIRRAQSSAKKEIASLPSRLRKYGELISQNERLFSAGMEAVKSDQADVVRRALDDVTRGRSRFDLVTRMFEADQSGVQAMRKELTADLRKFGDKVRDFCDETLAVVEGGNFARYEEQLDEALSGALSAHQKSVADYEKASEPLNADTVVDGRSAPALSRAGFSGSTLDTADDSVIDRLEKRLKELK